MTCYPTGVGQETTITLYRPVGRAELDLIVASGYTAFPPRLPIQPIFYPVLMQEYATRIARDWNTRDAVSGYEGFVLRFRVAASFLDRYPVRLAGGRRFREYWIPAEELPQFNAHIRGLIEVVESYAGRPPNGTRDTASSSRGPAP